MLHSQALTAPVTKSIARTRTTSQVARRKQQPVAPAIEEFSFLMKDFKIDHQGETNNLNISISYRYLPNIAKSDYPDFRLLAKDVETLLTNYPNEDDYWEIVNKQLTALLLKKYPALMSVTCELKVDPSRIVPYTRSSRVTRERQTIRLKHR
ncbi:MAG: hypothetical protein V7638_4058 [Acidobacteriota bacterium]